MLTNFNIGERVIQINRVRIVHQHLDRESAFVNSIVHTLDRYHQLSGVVSQVLGCELRSRCLPCLLAKGLADPPFSVFQSIIAVEDDVAGQLKFCKT